jgi:predicted branched-subunit amino acid permease
MDESEGGPTRFTRAGALRGARAMLPLLPSAVAFGLLYGFLATERGMTRLEVTLSSALVCAGSAQFLAMELWAWPLPVPALAAAVLVVNLRHVLMGPVLLPWLRHLPPARTYASLFVMTDQSWGASVAELRRGGRDAAFLAGAGGVLWAAWVAASLAGTLAGDVSGFVERWGLGFLTVAFYVALLAGFWRGRGDLMPWLVAAGVALVARELVPGAWYVLAGALAGSAAGALRDAQTPR